jgi:hypothetical protein
MNCQGNITSTLPTQLPHKFSYIVAILGHNHFESPNIYYVNFHIGIILVLHPFTRIIREECFNLEIPAWKFSFKVGSMCAVVAANMNGRDSRATIGGIAPRPMPFDRGSAPCK